MGSSDTTLNATSLGITFSLFPLISNSKTHVIKNCGHMIILENAFEMREKIVEFLKK